MPDPVIIGDATLYLGDCRDVLPTLGKVDAVIVDPPYGIGFAYNSYNDTRENLVEHVSNLMKFVASSATRACILCGVTQISLYPEPDWIASVTWNTTGQFGKLGYTQWMPALFYGKDIAGFGSVNGTLKSDVYRISGGAGVGFGRGEVIDHPCPKPVNVMEWAVARFSAENDLVVDPFMGSGTTGVACAKMGRKFIGIEIEPKYFDIACRRIDAAYAEPDMFVSAPTVKPKQESFNV